eukprot:TRINITY_DN2665_c0_g2_i1.p2 TRINITY_DN2665_c0_g2~~TRINITY_DN2665_c0_g2_i1.p2  ORF type:complete len:129 (+),score=36.27 TRINITY_DN2665_c0_g2_i1:26-388(+)
MSLHNAAKQNDTNAIRTHVAAAGMGAGVDARSDSGWTALMWAANSGHAEAVALLLELGADVNATKNDGGSPLLIAAFSGHTAVVRLLLTAGADKEIRKDGKTARDFASEKGHTETAEALK